MTSRLRIVHRSDYTYDRPVTISLNEARLTPGATAWQIPLESSLHVEQATWDHTYFDYWGTQVYYFEARHPHEQLHVEASSTVEVDAANRPSVDLSVGWDVVRAEAVRDRFGEFLTQTRSTAPAPDLAALADDVAARLAPHEAALAVCSAVHERMTYLPGSTGVHTAGAEAWQAKSGVCQDYAHLAVGALRHLGLPARYVSGYLHPNRDPVVGESAVGESHAWLEWWLGEWTGHDPTNDVGLAERHVIVGRGRDYTDVPPIKGIIAGGAATSAMDVSVSIIRLA